MRNLVIGIMAIMSGILIGLFVLLCLSTKAYIICVFVVGILLVFLVQIPINGIVNKIFGKKTLEENNHE